MGEMVNEVTLYWTYLNHKQNQLVIAASPKGLCYVGSWDESLQIAENWARKTFNNVQWLRDEAMMKPYVQQLGEYLRRERTTFTLALDLQGTPFQLAVWEAMNEIPYGKTWTYSEVAQHLRKPQSVRAVGTAIGRNPVLIVAPCHRIIGKNGSLTGYRGGLTMKEYLLNLEGMG